LEAPSGTSYRRQSSYESDASENAPKFEEWTVVHKVPASQAAYDAVDSSPSKYQAETDSGENYDDQDQHPYSTTDSRQSVAHKRHFQSTDNINQTGSNESMDDAIPVEEIMPRRRSSGRRQRDAMVAAALRQLDSDNARGTAGDAPADRSSPYHSYQRIHHDRRGRYGDDIDARAGGSSSSNGNVFQDSFNVSRVNPAYYWRE
uniref:DUF3824 domain-containing protein n=1 Tax=Macrostomum lignano TaxID=282301 RepID=A0A1I8J1Y6_9PLAT